MKPKVYIAGPMTGLPGYNYPAFMSAAAELRGYGVDVINPVETFGGDTTLRYEEYVAEGERAVREDADAVYLLPGWESSTGARREITEALKRDLPIITQNTGTRALITHSRLMKLAGRVDDGSAALAAGQR